MFYVRQWTMSLDHHPSARYTFAFKLSISLCLLLLGCGLVNAQTSAPSLEALTKQLSSRRFVEREQAMLDLIDQGIDVIPALLEQIEKQNLEGITRSLYVLSELALSDQQGFRADSIPRQSMEKLATSPNKRIARQAASALNRINLVRENDAIIGLKALGAVWNDNVYSRFGAEPGYVRQLQFNSNWQGDADDLYMLPWVASAEELLIEEIEIDEHWFEMIGRMRKLTSLIVKRCPLDDSAAKHLAKLSSLVNLDIRYCPLTDAGLDQLHPLKKLTYVKLYGTQGTKVGAERLQQAIQAEMDFRMGAFLGVMCERPPEACYIESVQENSGAHKAGLLRGDIITAFDDRPVKDFEDLRRIVGEHVPGDKSKVKIERIGIPQTAVIKKTNETIVKAMLKPHPAGLLVEAIPEDCPLYQAGLRKGYVVTMLQWSRVKTAAELAKVIKDSPDGPVRVVYATNPKSMVIEVEFGEWD